MLATPELAQYLTAVIQAVVVMGRTDIPLTDTCPECGNFTVKSYMDAVDDLHVSIKLSGDTYAVVIGCEGYFVVNPNLVGILSPDWSDGSALGDEATGVHDAACTGEHPNGAPCIV